MRDIFYQPDLTQVDRKHIKNMCEKDVN